MPDVGDPVPDARVMVNSGEGPQSASSAEVLASGRILLIGVPGAFTPVCSDFHLPGLVLATDELAAKGIARVVVVSVNDAFVMDAWAKEIGAGPTFLMMADPDALFTKAMGRDTDATEFGLGIRSDRYSALVVDGVITSLDVEKRFVDHEVTSAEAVLARL